MKLFKSMLAVMIAIVLLANSAMFTAFAEEDLITEVEGLRWFPVPAERQNDDAWEVECVADGCLCQRFSETAEETGYDNYLDTEYTENGGLKISRNETTIVMGGIDYTERYWPRIRTISLETSPAFDLKTSNILYFDIEVAEGTEWNFALAINGMNISFGKFMAAAGGATLDPMDTSIVDAPAGHFIGSVNITDIVEQLAADTKQLDNVNAIALKNMKKTFVPQLQIYCVGGKEASLTIHELYLSTAEDTTGEKCSFVDMGLLTGLGNEYYEDIVGEETEPSEDETDPTEATTTTTEKVTSTTTATEETTTSPASAEKNDNDKSDDSDGSDEGGNMLPIVIAGIAVVVVGAAVAVVIVMKKKKA